MNVWDVCLCVSPNGVSIHLFFNDTVWLDATLEEWRQCEKDDGGGGNEVDDYDDNGYDEMNEWFVVWVIGFFRLKVNDVFSIYSHRLDVSPTRIASSVIFFFGEWKHWNCEFKFRNVPYFPIQHTHKVLIYWN